MLDTLDRITQAAAGQFGLDPNAIGPDQPVTEYGVDSLGLIELLFALEERFNVRFDGTLEEAPRTLRELAALVDSLRGEQGSATAEVV